MTIPFFEASLTSAIMILKQWEDNCCRIPLLQKNKILHFKENPKAIPSTSKSTSKSKSYSHHHSHQTQKRRKSIKK